MRKNICLFIITALGASLSAQAKDTRNAPYVLASTSRTIEECCLLMGETAACGINNNAISRTCGQMIDNATSYGSSARGQRLQNCMNIASSAATGSPDCEGVLKRMQHYR